MNISNIDSSAGAPSVADGTANARANKGKASNTVRTGKKNTINNANAGNTNANTQNNASVPAAPAGVVATIAVIDETTLQRKAAAYQEEQKKKAVQWFRSVGAAPTTAAEKEAILLERQMMDEEIARRARARDLGRLAVENIANPAQLYKSKTRSPRRGEQQQQQQTNADADPTSAAAAAAATAASAPLHPVPLSVIEAVMSHAFPHDDPAVIAAINKKLEAHNKGDNGANGKRKVSAAAAAGAGEGPINNNKDGSSNTTGGGDSNGGETANNAHFNPSRKDLLLGNTGPLTSLDALTRTAKQASILAAIAANNSPTSNGNNNNGGASSPAPSTKKGSSSVVAATAGVGPLVGALSSAEASAILNGTSPLLSSLGGGDDDANGDGGDKSGGNIHSIANRRKKVAADLETDKLLQFALAGDLYVGLEANKVKSDGFTAPVTASASATLLNNTNSATAPNATGGGKDNLNTSAGGGGRTNSRGKAGGGGSGAAASAADLAAVNAALVAQANQLVITADGTVTSVASQQALEKEKAEGNVVADKVHTLFEKLVSAGRTTDGQAGAGLEARHALREQLALMARVVMLRQRFDRRTQLAMKAIRSSAIINANSDASGVNISPRGPAGGVGGGGTVRLTTTAEGFVVPPPAKKGVEFAKSITLIEMPSLLPPTGDNPLTAVVVVPNASASAATDGEKDQRQSSSAQGVANNNGNVSNRVSGGALDVSVSGSPNGKMSTAGSKAAAKAAALAQQQAQLQQQQQRQQQEQQERRALMLRLAPATVVADPTDPNHLSLMGERLSSATQMAVMAPKKPYTPFAFKLKGYKPFPFPASERLSADPCETVPILPAGPEAVPEPHVVVPALEHFAQPIPTLETFPLPRHTAVCYGGVSISDSLLSFDEALHTNIGSQWSHVHSRTAATSQAASALSLATLAPQPFLCSNNASVGVGGCFGAGASLGANVVASLAGQQQEAAQLAALKANRLAKQPQKAEEEEGGDPFVVSDKKNDSAFTMPGTAFLNNANGTGSVTTTAASSTANTAASRRNRNRNKKKSGGGGGTPRANNATSSPSSSSAPIALTSSSAASRHTDDQRMAQLRTLTQLLGSAAIGGSTNSPSAAVPTASNSAAAAAVSANSCKTMLLRRRHDQLYSDEADQTKVQSLIGASAAAPPALSLTNYVATLSLKAVTDRAAATQNATTANNNNNNKKGTAATAARPSRRGVGGSVGYGVTAIGASSTALVSAGGCVPLLGGGGGGSNNSGAASAAPPRMRYADPRDDLSDESDDDEGIMVGGGGGGSSHVAIAGGGSGGGDCVAEDEVLFYPSSLAAADGCPDASNTADGGENAQLAPAAAVAALALSCVSLPAHVAASVLATPRRADGGDGLGGADGALGNSTNAAGTSSTYSSPNNNTNSGGGINKRTSSPNSGGGGLNSSMSLAAGQSIGGNNTNSPQQQALPHGYPSAAVFSPQQQQYLLNVAAAAAAQQQQQTTQQSGSGGGTSQQQQQQQQQASSFPLTPQQQVEEIANNLMDREVYKWQEAVEGEGGEGAGDEAAAALSRLQYVATTGPIAPSSSSSSLPPRPSPMLDTRLSFVLSSQLRASLPNGASPYGLRGWIPLPSSSASAVQQQLATSTTTHAGSLSSVASTVQRLSSTVPASHPSAFFP